MAKKQISTYKFIPGVPPPAYGQYPKAVALLTANEIFLQEEISAYIALQVAANVSNSGSIYYGYVYDATRIAKCKRDIGYLIDGIIYDLTYGGNSTSYQIANRYYVQGVLQVVQSAVEVDAQTWLRNKITTNILTNTAYTRLNTVTTQVTIAGQSGETGGITQTTTLFNISINAISTGLSSIPAVVAPNSQIGSLLPNTITLLEANKRYMQEEVIAYIAYNVANNISPYVSYTYNSEKCRRDVSYVIEGYITDLKHGGNRQTIFNANYYWLNGVAQVDGDRLPEVYAHTFLKGLIQNYILTNTAFGSRNTIVSQVTNNSILSETSAYTSVALLSDIVIDVIQYGITRLPTTISNRGAVKFPGFYKLKDILLITNTSRNVILYNFADATYKAEVTYTEQYDSDFPGALWGNDRVTTITFDIDTTTHMVTDNIQIFVEGAEQIVRLNKIATDAMERMKVGIPQSMLDADFEYGLQPTKWQALALMRNYPAIYEIPGSDIAVISVVTDASAGTADTGASQITVTTQSAHGLVAGDAITIKALANSISGFSRAEGSFLLATASGTTLTYFAKSKVGTSNGQQLSSTYTQLRKGNYYTGAGISNATFSVYSAGSSGTITTALVTPAGVDVIGFSGSTPPLGAPLSGTGINSGTQITAIAGPGGTAASTTLLTNASIGDTTINITSTAGIIAGLVLNRGDGQSVLVTSISSNTVTLSGPLTSNITGLNGSFTSVTQTSTNGIGTGAVFTVSRSSGVYTTTVTAPGTGYVAGNTITFAGAGLGGTTPTNNAVATVGTASPVKSVTGFNNGSLVASAGSAIGLATTNLSTTVSPSGGTGLTVDISTDGSAVLSVSVGAGAGAGYTVADVITIGQLGRVSTIDTIVAGSGYSTSSGLSTTGGSGTGLTVNITDNGSGGITAVTINNIGSGYTVGNTITVVQAGGSSGTFNIATLYPNATIAIASVAAGGLIQSISGTTGTAISAPSIDFTSAITISDVTTSQIASGNTGITYSAIATIQVTFASDHGFIPGDTITSQITSVGTGAQLAAGPFFVEQVPLTNVFRYTARAAGTIENTLAGIIYGRPDSFFIHRPFDGGVQLGTASPSHGASAIRMSKKYIRYQSGKGVTYNTGALFAPSYDLRSLTASATTVGSVITVTTDDTDHGLQVGGNISINGVVTSGYNGTYTVTDISNERVFRVLAQVALGSTTAVLGTPCFMSVQNWHGSTVRSGIFDDQNGMFWQYDGIRMAVVKRSSTFQIAGTISISANSNLVTGTNTRFTQQLAAGDRIVIRGMSHVISSILNNVSMSVTPAYRGISNVTDAKCTKTQDLIIPQEDWNFDPLNGSGPSGYTLDVTKMQMIGIQHTWYGAGFIDFMLRGPDGNYTFAHRFRNSNVNTEAYMRTGNQPVRYEVINEGAKGRLTAAMTNSQTTIPLDYNSAYWFPKSGTVYIDNELIQFSGNNGYNLTGCTRAANLTQFTAGSQRNFSAGPAASHASDTGVVLVSNTITPNISHWGSAFMIDGQFDSDRGYIFNYATTAVSVSTSKRTAFLIRLAPSVSNAQVGDLGDKELLNRAQLLLSGISITSDSVAGGGGIVIEGVLNPQNYPTDPTKITWTGLSSNAAGGQPSFAQIAAGGSVSWAGNVYTSTATVQGAFTTTVLAKSFTAATNTLTATSFSTITATAQVPAITNVQNTTYQFAFSTARTDFLIPQSVYAAYTTPILAGDTVRVATYLLTQTVVSVTASYITINSIVYARVIMNTVASATSPTNTAVANVTFTSALSITYNAAISTGRNDFLIPQTQYAASTLAIADVLSVTTFITGSQSVSSVTPNYCVLAGTSYARIIMTAFGSATSTAGTGNNQSVTSTSAATATYGRALSTTRNDFLITDAAYAGSGLVVGDVLSLATFLTGSQTIAAITPSYITISSVVYTRIVMSAVANSNSTTGSGNDQTVTVTAAGTAATYVTTNFLFFTSATWIASGATIGTNVAADQVKFPAGTSIAQISTRTYSGTTVYRVTFTQTTNATFSAADTLKFQFGNAYALPGEQVFSFIANPGESATLSLDALKELTATTIGGRGAFPNGPDVLAVNVYKVSGTATPANIILRWGEAQA